MFDSKTDVDDDCKDDINLITHESDLIIECIQGSPYSLPSLELS